MARLAKFVPVPGFVGEGKRRRYRTGRTKCLSTSLWSTIGPGQSSGRQSGRNMKKKREMLLVAKSLDWIEMGSLAGWVVTEEHAHRDGEGEPTENGREGKRRGPSEESAD